MRRSFSDLLLMRLSLAGFFARAARSSWPPKVIASAMAAGFLGFTALAAAVWLAGRDESLRWKGCYPAQVGDELLARMLLSHAVLFAAIAAVIWTRRWRQIGFDNLYTMKRRLQIGLTTVSGGAMAWVLLAATLALGSPKEVDYDTLGGGLLLLSGAVALLPLLLKYRWGKDGVRPVPRVADKGVAPSTLGLRIATVAFANLALLAAIGTSPQMTGDQTLGFLFTTTMGALTAMSALDALARSATAMPVDVAEASDP